MSREMLKTHERSHNALEHVLALASETSSSSDGASGGDSNASNLPNGDELSFECGICLMDFASYSSLVVHTRTHTTELPFVCGRCPAIFASESMLKSHAETHTPERPLLSSGPSEGDVKALPVVEPRFECNDCVQTFGRLADLEAHAGAHAVQRPCGCRRCGKTFSSKAAFKIHKKQLGPFKCVLSSEPLSASSGIREPDVGLGGSTGSIAHSDGNTEHHVTPDADPSRDVEDHVDTDAVSVGSPNQKVEANENGPPFQCDICSTPFFTKSALVVHKQRRACKDYLKCPSCPMRFATGYERRSHGIIHATSDILFNCDLCPRTFTVKRAVMQHRKLSHGVRPSLKCLKCPAMFGSKRDLQRHVETHWEPDNEARTSQDIDGQTRTSRDLDDQTEPL